MGLFSWLCGDRSSTHAAENPASAPTTTAEAPELAPGCPVSDWEPLAPYIPYDAAAEPHVVVIAAALAAGERKRSELTVRRILKKNPEHARVTAIAAAIAAGNAAASDFTVKRIYKKKDCTAQQDTEESHAA